MLRGLWVILVFVAATGVLAPLAILGELARPGRDVTFRLGRVWCRIHLRALGVRPDYGGLENVPPGPCVFVSNHLSIVDIWAIAPVLPSPTRFVAKQSLFRIPLFGWALYVGGFIPIDRERRDRAIGSMGRATDHIRAGGSILLFAEGTRSRTGRLLPFKKGAFRLALETGVPVVPIAVSGSGRVVRPGTIVARPGPVRVAIAPRVLPVEGGEAGLDSLMADVRAAIVARLAPDEVEGSTEAPTVTV